MSSAVDSFGTSYSLKKVNESNPIVFIHCVGLNKEIWIPQINFFKDYTTLTFDLLGHGKTPLKKSSLSIKDLSDQLFNLINECYMSGTRIYLSSTSVTKDLRIRLTDLASRLSSFTAIEIPEITEEEKIEALIQSSKRKGFVLDKKTVQYIVSYTSRNLSDLLKLLNELDSFSLQKKRKISLPIGPFCSCHGPEFQTEQS